MRTINALQDLHTEQLVIEHKALCSLMAARGFTHLLTAYGPRPLELVDLETLRVAQARSPSGTDELIETLAEARANQAALAKVLTLSLRADEAAFWAASPTANI